MVLSAFAEHAHLRLRRLAHDSLAGVFDGGSDPGGIAAIDLGGSGGQIDAHIRAGCGGPNGRAGTTAAAHSFH